MLRTFVGDVGGLEGRSLGVELRSVHRELGDAPGDAKRGQLPSPLLFVQARSLEAPAVSDGSARSLVQLVSGKLPAKLTANSPWTDSGGKCAMAF